MFVTIDHDNVTGGCFALMVIGGISYGMYAWTGLVWVGWTTGAILTTLGVIFDESIRKAFIGLLVLGAIGWFIMFCINKKNERDRLERQQRGEPDYRTYPN
jgi:MFS-type transporter involved in bile tolerance (Atg22 family)